jgi:hypothetical protein
VTRQIRTEKSRLSAVPPAAVGKGDERIDPEVGHGITDRHLPRGWQAWEDLLVQFQ